MEPRAVPPGRCVRLSCAIAASVRVAVVLLIGGCAAVRPAASDAAPPAAVTPRFDSFVLLREAADHEALYTLAGGLKPMSTGVWQGVFAVEEPDLTELRSVRAALGPLRNDTWYADVQVFASIHEGQRFAHAFVVHRGAMARMIERFEPFWSPWGIAPCTHPSEVLAIVDRMPKAERWRGFGYLFGFPPESVDFFVEAGLAAVGDQAPSPGADRQFVHIPTYAADSGRFTYAAPPGHVQSEADEALASEARRILLAYSERRDRMRDADSLISELLRLDRRFERSAIRAARSRDVRPVAGRAME